MAKKLSAVDTAAEKLETEIIEFANAAVRLGAAFLAWVVAKRSIIKHGQQTKLRSSAR